MDEISAANLNARIDQAVFRVGHVKAFLSRFPPIDPSDLAILPAISWDQIARQLRSLAGADFERASWELEVLKATARTTPAELFYRELFTLAWSLIDEASPLPSTEAAMD